MIWQTSVCRGELRCGETVLALLPGLLQLSRRDLALDGFNGEVIAVVDEHELIVVLKSEADADDTFWRGWFAVVGGCIFPARIAAPPVTPVDEKGDVAIRLEADDHVGD